MRPRKPGRVPGDPDQLLTAQVLVRCTFDDRDELKEAARRDDASLSEWLRDLGLEAARRQRTKTQKTVKA